MQFKHILVIADPQDKQQMALAWAKSLANDQKLKLHVVAFCYEATKGLGKKLSDEQKQALKKNAISQRAVWLEKTLSKTALPGTVSSDTVWTRDIGKWVKSYCESNRCDLIVKTGHRTETMFYTPTDWHVMRNGHSPVLLVAEKRWRRKQTVMVSLDLGSRSKTKKSLNQTLINAAITMANEMQLPLHVAYSLPISPMLKDLGIIDKDKELAKAHKKLVPKILDMAGDYALPEENIHIKVGEPHLVIPSLASEFGAALMVIGTVGRKGLKAKLMGNTAESTLSLLKTNVLVLQPD